MKIVIMRHGKPGFDFEAIKFKRMSSTQLGEIIYNYALSTLDPSSQPSSDSRRMVGKCHFSICSDLPRAIISCELLGGGENNTVDPCFRESALPFLDWHQPRLTFFSWAIIFRFAWLLGFSRNGESCKEAKLRSKLGADKLGPVHTKFLTESMTKICSDQMPSGYEAEIMMLSRSKHIISNKV